MKHNEVVLKLDYDTITIGLGLHTQDTVFASEEDAKKAFSLLIKMAEITQHVLGKNSVGVEKRIIKP